ncbi:Putative histone H3/CENP-A [Septoria linicola]|uniref:Histone H3/CENP-A n=1 Tax=Septoria linicola TaxID=215465 RepID=A0A9Q9EN95_9PEZI|nr:putative histone H3/CENP-A [Septoria linicola]USW55263.1 Putative histone H3/CENP-A [Septoria linicola]
MARTKQTTRKSTGGRAPTIPENRLAGPTTSGTEPAQESSSTEGSSETSSRPAKRKLDCWDAIAITVGRCKDERTFHVPSQVILERSKVVAKHYQYHHECKPQSTAAYSATFTDFSSKAFNTYVQLLFQDRIVLFYPDQNEDAREKWTALIELYFLAAKLEDPKSMNQIIEKIFWHSSDYSPDLQDIRTIYAMETLFSGPLRRLVVDDIAIEENMSVLELLAAQTDVTPFREFFRDMSRRLMKDKSSGRWGGMSEADYHVEE